MKSMTSSEAKKKFGLLMDTLSKEPVILERYGRPYAVILSMSDYNYLISDAYDRKQYKDSKNLLELENELNKLTKYDSEYEK